MDAYIIDWGIFSIKWYSVLMLVAVLLAIFIVLKRSEQEGIDKKFLVDLVFYTIIFGIIGARFYYVVFNLDYYSKDWWSIFKIWEGGLAIHGAIIAGLIYMFYYCKIYSQEFLKITDISALALLLGQAIGRWGNFFNQEAYGQITKLSSLKKLHIPEFIINGMNVNGIYYQPTFLYESIWCLTGFIALFILRKVRKLQVGTLSCLYAIWYGIGRFVIEIYRSDSLSFIGIKAAQVVSIMLILLGISGLMLIKNKSKILVYLNNVNRWKE